MHSPFLPPAKTFKGHSGSRNEINSSPGILEPTRQHRRGLRKVSHSISRSISAAVYRHAQNHYCPGSVRHWRSFLFLSRGTTCTYEEATRSLHQERTFVLPVYCIRNGIKGLCGAPSSSAAARRHLAFCFSLGFHLSFLLPW